MTGSRSPALYANKHGHLRLKRLNALPLLTSGRQQHNKPRLVNKKNNVEKQRSGLHIVDVEGSYCISRWALLNPQRAELLDDTTQAVVY